MGERKGWRGHGKMELGMSLGMVEAAHPSTADTPG